MPENNNETTTRFNVDISQLKASMQEARRQIQIANSEFRAASAGMDDWATSTDGLQAKLTQLKSNLASQKTILRNLSQQYAAVVQEQGEGSAAAQRLQVAINNQRATIRSTEREIDQYSDRLETVERAERIAAEEGRDVAQVLDELAREADNAADDMADLGDSAASVEGGFSILKGAIADLVADGIKKIGELTAALVTDSGNAFSQFAASTGVAADAMDDYEEAIQNVYKDNFGESLEDVAEKMAKVKEVTGELDASKLQDMTEKAITLEDTFGMDMTETLRGVQNLMNHFGLSSKEAFDLMAAGAQNGLNYSDELGDNVAEYAGKFAEAGFTASEYFQLLQNGSAGGAYNLDKVNDAINEVTTRLADDTIADSLLAVDEETGEVVDGTGHWSQAVKDVFNKWQEGGATQKDVINEIVKDIQNTKEEQDKMNKAALAFGTMAEDGGTKFIEALSPVGDTFDDVKGKAEEIESIKYDNFASALAGVGRVLKVDLLQPLADKLMPYMEEFTGYITENAPNIVQTVHDGVSDIVEKVKEVISFVQQISPLLAGLGTVLAGLALAGVAQNITSIAGALGAWAANTNIATAAQWLLNAAMSANPVTLIVIAIAGLVAAFATLWKKSDAFREFWIGLWDKIKEAISAFVSSVVDTIKSLPGKMWDWLKNTISKIGEWASDLISEGADAAKGFGDSVINGIKSIPEKVKDIGKNIVTGMWEGITDKFDWLTKKIKGFAGDVTDKIKSFFGIHSPSRIMRDEVGKNIALGVAEGISKNAAYVGKSAEEMNKIVLDRAKEDLDTYETYHDLSLANEVSYWDEIRKHVAEGTSERVSADKEYLSKKKDLNDKIKTLDQNLAKDTKEIYANLKTDIAELWDEYKNTVNDRASSIASSFSLTDNPSFEIGKSKDTLKKSMKAQVDALKQWDTTLTKLSKRKGMTDDFMQELQGMDYSQLGTLQSINSMSDKELKEYIKLYEQKNKVAKSRARKENAALKEDTKKQVKDLKQNAKKQVAALNKTYESELAALGVTVKKEGKQIGNNLAAGIKEGISGGVKSVKKSAKDLTKSITKEMKKSLKIHSPSKLMKEEIGKNIALGVAGGINDNAKSVMKSMRNLANDTLSAANVGTKTGGYNATSTAPQSTSINFYQTNNSPKSLSRLEIYRQTKNLLNAKGGAYV